MKKRIMRMFTLVLVVCSLVIFSMPVVLATGEDGDYDAIYTLHADEFVGKRHEEVTPILAQRFADGTSNWKIESGIGIAQFADEYVRFGTVKTGNCWAIRIKSPGTGTYEITLKYMQGYEANAADLGRFYIIEAPNTTIAGSKLKNYTTCDPVMEYTGSCDGSNFLEATNSGTYGFREDKEYIVIFYANDESDSHNPTKSTYIYVDSLVMNRIGEYVESEKTIHQGDVVIDDFIEDFRTAERVDISNVNGHDYLAMATYSGTLMIFDLDERCLVDQVDTDISDPWGVVADQNGNFWVGGNQTLFSYNPYTCEGYNTGKVTSGENNFEMVNGDDGYLYFGAYYSTRLEIYKYDPVKLTYQRWIPEIWAPYPGAVKQKGDYIYIAASSEDSHEIWKMDKYTGRIVDRVGITSQMDGKTYVSDMAWLDDAHLIVGTADGPTVVDTNTMEKLYPEEVGLRGNLVGVASDVIDGKTYFVSDEEGLCYFDVEAQTFGAVGGELADFKIGLCTNKLVTLENGLWEYCLITVKCMSADELNIYAIDLNIKSSITINGLVEPDSSAADEPVEEVTTADEERIENKKSQKTQKQDSTIIIVIAVSIVAVIGIVAIVIGKKASKKKPMNMLVSNDNYPSPKGRVSRRSGDG